MMAEAKFLHTQTEPKLVRDRLPNTSYGRELIKSIVLQAVGAPSRR